MKRFLIPLAALGLMACEPTVPDSAAGVGFGSYNSYQEARIAREQELIRQARPGVAPGAQVIGGETIAAVDPAIGTPPAPVQGDPLPLPQTADVAAAPVVTTNNPGISDEQDFQAVSGRETIESDAERRARQAAAYQVVQPEALPTRPGSAGPNIVAYALSTTNRVGEQVYRRSGFNAEARFDRACASYRTADQAQQDFLASGGPERDRRGVDPDGDGFACFWDPTPFRAARTGALGAQQ